VAVSARIPLLCLGDDGTSKTLSLNLVLSQMQGRFSSQPLLRAMRRVQPFHLQLSEATTAKQIVELKSTVVAWNAGRDVALESHPCVCMEEMSMAEQGPTGPLRALHDLLDSHQESRARRREDVGTGTNNFSFVSTSNYLSDNSRTLPTGRALGNRLLVLAHEPLPANSLIDLAVCTGRGAFGDRSDGASQQPVERVHMLEATITALCNERELSKSATRLVPDLISIRSLLYFSRSLASLLAADVPLHEAQVRAFACNLQLQTAEKTKQLWTRVDKALGWSQGGSFPVRPTTTSLVHDAFRTAKTKRPLLFLYTNSLDIHQAIHLCSEAADAALSSSADSEHVARPKQWLICPASKNMVCQRKKSASLSVSSASFERDLDGFDHGILDSDRAGHGGHVLHAMVGI
jgi:hypothetical protein